MKKKAKILLSIMLCIGCLVGVNLYAQATNSQNGLVQLLNEVPKYYGTYCTEESARKLDDVLA